MVAGGLGDKMDHFNRNAQILHGRTLGDFLFLNAKSRAYPGNTGYEVRINPGWEAIIFNDQLVDLVGMSPNHTGPV